MAVVSRPNAYRRRRKLIVNPSRRLSLAQRLAGFGGKRSQAAARSAKHRARSASARAKQARPAVNSSSRKRSTGGSRQNISAILTAGLPAANPHRPKKRTGNSMASTSTHRRRRRGAAAHSTKRRRRTTRRTTAVSHFRRRHRRRTNGMFSSAPRRRNSSRRNSRRGFAVYRRRRHIQRNPSMGGVTKTVINWGVGAAGALGSRIIPNLLLPTFGIANSGVIGYLSNVGAGWLLALIAQKTFGREAHNVVLFGTGIGLVLRIVQDLGVLGNIVDRAALNTGMGDVGVLLPSNFADPAIFTGNGAQRRVPAGWGPAPALPPAAGPGKAMAAKAGMGASTYKRSTY